MNAAFGQPAVLAIVAAGALVMPTSRRAPRSTTGVGVPATPPAPSIAYTLRIDPSRLDVVDVAIQLEGAPRSVRLAMKVHPEYDAQYWRYLDSARVEGSPTDGAGSIIREDSTVWRVTLPAGRGTVRYCIHVQPPRGAVRAGWRAFVAPTGALINSPDFFLYLPDFASVPVTLDLLVPREWRIATSLAPRDTPTGFSAPDAAALLDAPVLLGDLHEWAFRDRETTFHVAYWPVPQATPFDTVAFVDDVRCLVRATLDVFGRAPTPDFFFLIQDGTRGALEHAASVTIGMPSAALASDRRAALPELAHEFFHTWNLVAIHPDHYGELSYQAPTRTTGLWWGEGVTIHYADALTRRAGLVDGRRSRLDHLADVLKSYYGAAWSGRVSPERASLAFGDSPLANPDATGAYYLQGELLGEEIDALVRDATHDARGLDDVMRALFRQSAGGHGFTSARLEAVIDSVCGCRLDQVFATQVRGSALIDVAPVVGRLGFRLSVDTVPAVDSAAAPLPDRRLGIDFTRPGPPLRLVVSNPASAWSRAGLRTGDDLIAIEGRAVQSFGDLRRVLEALRVGDTAVVEIARAGAGQRLRVGVTGYREPRVRFSEAPELSAAARTRRARWLGGW
jgi:predicted metalloprotease with PDZ domain